MGHCLQDGLATGSDATAEPVLGGEETDHPEAEGGEDAEPDIAGKQAEQHERHSRDTQRDDGLEAQEVRGAEITRVAGHGQALFCTTGGLGARQLSADS